jgi:hypothetical protein
MTLTVTTVIAAHCRLDQTGPIVARARNGIAVEAQDRGGSIRSRRLGRRGSMAEVLRDGGPNDLPDFVVGH